MTIFTKLRGDVRTKLANELFEVRDNKSLDAADLLAYFQYYEEEIRLLRIGASENNWMAAHLAVQSHEDILEIICMLKNNTDQNKEDVRENLQLQHGWIDPLSVDRSIDLCLRLWLMLNINDIQFQSLRPLDTCLTWNCGTNLESFVKHVFDGERSRYGLSFQESTFDEGFTVATMMNIRDLRIHWTSNMFDHLALNRRKRILSVFAFEHQIRRTAGLKSPIPESVLGEYVRSLNLLFPVWDRRTEELLTRERRPQPWWADSSMYGDSNTWDGKRALNLNDFDFLRNRLRELNEEVFKAPPATWTQLWRDRQNPQLFYTFWLAFAILILTIGQFITGVVQAWASLQALKASH